MQMMVNHNDNDDDDDASDGDDGDDDAAALRPLFSLYCILLGR